MDVLPACMTCTICAWCLWKQKRSLGFLELELQIVVSFSVAAGNSRASGRAASAPAAEPSLQTWPGIEVVIPLPLSQVHTTPCAAFLSKSSILCSL